MIAGTCQPLEKMAVPQAVPKAKSRFQPSKALNCNDSDIKYL